MSENETLRSRREQDDPDVEGHGAVTEEIDPDDPEKRKKKASEEPEDDEFSRRKR
jgi:hypothetical protein